jgi:anti-anti-sigma regulatory factor
MPAVHLSSDTILPPAPGEFHPVASPAGAARPRSTGPSTYHGVDPLQITLRCDGTSGLSEVQLEGELDGGNARRLVDAVAWLRRRGRGLVVVDTRGLTFLDRVGYRALRDVTTSVSAGSACGVVHRGGAAVLRFERTGGGQPAC